MKTLVLVTLTRLRLHNTLQKSNLIRGLSIIQSRAVSDQHSGNRFISYNRPHQQKDGRQQQEDGRQQKDGRQQEDGRQQQQDGRQHEERKYGSEMVLLALSTAAAAFAYCALQTKSFLLLADDNTVAYENRIRQYSTVDQIFNYFSTYLLSQRNSTGGMSKTVMMAPMDLFNAITPESPGHAEAMDGAAGAGNYITVTQEEIPTLELKKSPVANSVLNEIGNNGLLTYNDFCFLLTVLSTPRRHNHTAFRLFDINGDNCLEEKEFSYIAQKLLYNAGGFGDYRSHNKDKSSENRELLDKESGFLNYLFGKDRAELCSEEKFVNFTQSLQDEIIELEFREYDKENTGRISELDLGKFLLKNAKLPPKTEKRMLKRVEKVWPSKKRGISLASFKNLYQILAGGEDLQRAIIFLDEGLGIDYEQFRKVCLWVSHSEVSDHVAKVIFVLLDDDQNGNLTIEEIQHILLSWRKSRGFEKLTINVNVGPKKNKKD